MTTLEEYYTKVNEVNQEKGGKVLEDANWQEVIKTLGLPPCKLHTIKAGQKCRTCIELQAELSSITKKKNVNGLGNSYNSNYVREPLKQLNSTLVENVLNWKYYKDKLSQINDLENIVAEIRDNFDTYEPWISTKHGTPSIFWACLVRLSQIMPNAEKLVEKFSSEIRTHLIVFLALFLRLQFLPLKTCEIFLKNFDRKCTLDFGNEKIELSVFLEELLNEYKMWGIVLPEIELVEARKINWEIYQYKQKKNKTGNENEEII